MYRVPKRIGFHFQLSAEGRLASGGDGLADHARRLRAAAAPRQKHHAQQA